jgi:predicted nucleic acid-binding protein
LARGSIHQCKNPCRRRRNARTAPTARQTLAAPPLTLYLIDTNVLSELPRRRPNPHALRWLEHQKEVLLSVVSIEELTFGVARAPAAQQIRLIPWFDALLDGVTRILEITPTISRASGDLRAAREAAGRRVAQADMLIAATALVHGLTLATRNVHDFEACGIILFNPFAT